MSYPVFLDSAPQLRMPDGSANEWSTFFAKDKPELEANNFLPLLWLALFRVEDLQWARLIDREDWDEDMRSSALERAADAEVLYPYLVTTRESGLALFVQRKAALQSAVGPRYAAVVDAFESLIQHRYGPNLLLRTAGLPDPEALEPSLRAELIQIDAFCNGTAMGSNVVNRTAKKLQQQSGKQSLYLLSGATTPEDPETWPPAEIAAALEQIPAQKSPAPPKHSALPQQGESLGSKIRDWCAALFLGLVTVAVLLYTKSILWAVLCFFSITAVVIALVVRSANCNARAKAKALETSMEIED